MNWGGPPETWPLSEEILVVRGYWMRKSNFSLGVWPQVASSRPVDGPHPYRYSSTNWIQWDKTCKKKQEKEREKERRIRDKDRQREDRVGREM